MTDTRSYTHWECSSSYEQHYAKDRSHVAHMLGQFGVNSSNDWPERATVSDISVLSVTESWFHMVVDIGRRGIRQCIHMTDLPLDVREEQTKVRNGGYTPVWQDWYFVERLYGNKMIDRMPTLQAYCPIGKQVMIVTLGCNHHHASVVERPTKNYVIWQCPTCMCRWGVDDGD